MWFNLNIYYNYEICLISGIKDVNADHAASHLGRCQSLITLLRATTFHAKRNKVYLPQEMLLKVLFKI